MLFSGPAAKQIMIEKLNRKVRTFTIHDYEKINTFIKNNYDLTTKTTSSITAAPAVDSKEYPRDNLGFSVTCSCLFDIRKRSSNNNRKLESNINKKKKNDSKESSGCWSGQTIFLDQKCPPFLEMKWSHKSKCPIKLYYQTIETKGI